MLRLFLFLAVTLLAAYGISWLLTTEGHFTLDWLGYRVETAPAILILALLCFSLGLLFLFMLLSGILHAKRTFLYERRIRRQRLGMESVTRALAFLAISDLRGAQRMNLQAEKFLGSSPITLLVAAQLARAEGDEPRTKKLLEAMLDQEETQPVAMRGLVEYAKRRGNVSEALYYAERANDNKTGDVWASQTLIDLYTRQRKWQEALQVIDREARQGKLSRAQARHHRAVIHTLQAHRLFDNGQYELSEVSAAKAYKFSPALAPAAAIYARSLYETGKEKLAVKIIRNSWKILPYPALAVLYKKIYANENAEKYLARIQTLVHGESSQEGRLLLAEAFINAGRQQAAETLLLQTLAQQESARACRLMAQLKHAAHDHEGEASWLMRAASANPDATWQCRQCGQQSLGWQAHCGSCNGYDTYRWEIPRRHWVETRNGDLVG